MINVILELGKVQVIKLCFLFLIKMSDITAPSWLCLVIQKKKIRILKDCDEDQTILNNFPVIIGYICFLYFIYIQMQ